MNTSGALRHSKSHRTAIKRQWAGQMMRYAIEIPMRGGARLGKLDASTLQSILRLPERSVVRRQSIAEYGELYQVVVDIPRGACLIVAKDIAVREVGLVRPVDRAQSRPHGTVPRDYTPWPVARTR